MNAKSMKRRRGSRNRHGQVDLPPEYRFDYTKSRPNRFARRIAKNAVVVVLDCAPRSPRSRSQARDGRADNRLKLRARGRSAEAWRLRTRAAA